MQSAWGRILLAALVVIATALPGYADKPTFAELLARAKAQAAVGHKWLPAGDNMTETVVSMMDLLQTATAEQLSELSALLENEKTAATSETEPQAETRTAIAAPPPAMKTRPTVDAALATPDRPAPKPPVQVAPRPGPRALELFARGQQAELRGDVSGARRFYTGAATQGHAEAARNLGRLYDPAYLKQTAVGGIDPDPALARQWYERAVAMGDSAAGPLLEALSMR
jgi:TPR repeat protein